MARSKHHTGWAGTFLTAGELSRRGYDVTLTLGNTPSTDLLCSPQSGPGFRVEVKSAKTPNFVPIGRRVLETTPNEHLYFVIVLVPEALSKSPKYHVLTHAEVCALWAAMPKTKHDGSPHKPGWEGLNWGDVAKHEARWDKLPPAECPTSTAPVVASS